MEQAVNARPRTTLYDEKKNIIAEERSPATKGWQSADMVTTTPSIDDDPTKVPPRRPTVEPADGTELVKRLTILEGSVDDKEALDLLEKACDDLSPEQKQFAANVLDKVPTGAELLKRQMDALSQAIDNALQGKESNHELIHVLLLHFLVILMRQVVKSDKEYTNVLGDQIKVHAGEIRDSYNTWPVVVMTVSASVISVGGGAAGFAHLVFPNSAYALACAQNAQQISGVGTAFSNMTSLCSSKVEASRGFLQITLRRTEEKEGDRKGGSQGVKDTLRALKESAKEVIRQVIEAARSMLSS